MDVSIPWNQVQLQSNSRIICLNMASVHSHSLRITALNLLPWTFVSCLHTVKWHHWKWLLWGHAEILPTFVMHILYCIFCCEHAAVWMVLSVFMSAHLILTPILQYSCHEIFRSNYHWQRWSPCERLRAKCQRTRSHMSKTNFALIWAFPACNFNLNSQMATKWCR